LIHLAVTDISSTDTHATALSALRVLIAAGGTGGHVYPGIAIADALRSLSVDVTVRFAGTRDRMEWQAVPKAGYEIDRLWISGLHRRFTPTNLLFPLKLGVSLIQSALILRRFRPHVVVSCGGFASGPVGWVAARMGIPLILQEQNSFPGMTTRMLAPHAKQIFTAFEEASAHLPTDKITLAGNPVRAAFHEADREKGLNAFGLTGEQPVLLVLGGSGGALAINSAMEQNVEELHDRLGLQILWQCGDRYYNVLESRVEPTNYPDLRLLSYIDDMSLAYAAADLVVSRAGAISCSELMLTGRPSILVPSPNVAGDHQNKNAASMVEAGAALLIRDEEISRKLVSTVERIIHDRPALDTMATAARNLSRPDAATVIAEQIKTIGLQSNE